MSKFEDKYTMGAELGKGAYAVVYRCTHTIHMHMHGPVFSLPFPFAIVGRKDEVYVLQRHVWVGVIMRSISYKEIWTRFFKRVKDTAKEVSQAL